MTIMSVFSDSDAFGMMGAGRGGIPNEALLRGLSACNAPATMSCDVIAKVTRYDPYKAGGVQLLPPGQVSDVVPVVVDALHAAFEVLPASAHRFAAVRHPSETELERKRTGKKINGLIDSMTD